MKLDSSDKKNQVSLRSRILSLPTLIAFCIAIGFISFLLTRFDVEWSSTWDNISTMNPGLYFLAMLFYYASFVFRGIRWRILARNSINEFCDQDNIPSVKDAAQLIIIGWFVNSITWFRIGDAYRAYLFAEDSNRQISWSLGTVLAERVLDTVTVFMLLAVSSVFVYSSFTNHAGIYIVVAALAMALLLVFSLMTMKRYGFRIASILPYGLEQAYLKFHQGTLDSLKQFKILIGLGLLGWILEIARLYFVILALDLNVSIPLIIVVALGHAILSTVPTPGGVGAVEPGMIGILMIGVVRHEAISIVLVDRSITYLSVICVGGLVLLSRYIRTKRRGNITSTSNK